MGGPGGWGVDGFKIQKKKVSGRVRENPCHGRRDVLRYVWRRNFERRAVLHSMQLAI